MFALVNSQIAGSRVVMSLQGAFENPSIGQKKIEDVSFDHGAFPMRRDAGDRNRISAVPQHRAWNHQRKRLVASCDFAGGGDDAGPRKSPLRIVQVNGIRDVVGNARLQGKIDRKRNPVLAIGGYSQVRGAPRGPVQRSQGNETRLVCRRAQCRKRDQILVAENNQ